MCNKVVDTSPSAIKIVPECYKTQEVFHEAAVSYLILILIDINLKKCVINLFPKNLLC